jgi:hypothetical protein
MRRLPDTDEKLPFLPTDVPLDPKDVSQVAVASPSE